jgi:hypothetical protein
MYSNYLCGTNPYILLRAELGIIGFLLTYTIVQQSAGAVKASVRDANHAIVAEAGACEIAGIVVGAGSRNH